MNIDQLSSTPKHCAIFYTSTTGIQIDSVSLTLFDHMSHSVLMLALATISTAVTNAFGGAHGTNAFETALPGGTGGAVNGARHRIAVGSYSSLESIPILFHHTMRRPVVPNCFNALMGSSQHQRDPKKARYDVIRLMAEIMHHLGCKKFVNNGRNY